MASPEERPKFAELVFRDFGVIPTENLTRQQRYQLANRLVDQKLARYRLSIAASVFVALLLAGLIGLLAALDGRAEGATLLVRLSTPSESAVADTAIKGEVVLQAGQLHWSKPVEEGVARFDGLPSGVLEQPTVITPQVTGFRRSKLHLARAPSDGIVDLQLKPLPTVVCGRVVERNSPERIVSGATVKVAGETAITDDLGGFCVTVPSPPGTVESVSVLKDGVLGHRSYETIVPGNELILSFREET